MNGNVCYGGGIAVCLGRGQLRIYMPTDDEPTDAHTRGHREFDFQQLCSIFMISPALSMTTPLFFLVLIFCRMSRGSHMMYC